jgi:hypothetical protein
MVGQRMPLAVGFLIPTPVEQASGGSITVVVNWTAGLKK